MSPTQRIQNTGWFQVGAGRIQVRPRISVLENKVALEGEWGHIKGPRIWYERALTGKNGIIWSSKRVMTVMAYDTLAI